MTNVKKSKKRVAKTLLTAFVMTTALAPLLSMGVGSVSAQEPEYKINLGNVDIDQQQNKLDGSTYTITQTKGAYNPQTGRYADPVITDAFDVKISNEAQNLPQGVEGVYEDGVMKLKLPEGTYSIVQKSAPVGRYLKDGSVETIVVELPQTIEGNRLVNEVNVTPKSEEIRKKITFTKYTGTQDATLDGATFKLYRTTDLTSADPTYTEFNVKDEANGARVADTNWDTDKTAFKTANGVFSVENLPYGKYYIQENTAPETHVLSKEKVKFEVKQEGMNRDTENVNLTANMNNFKVPSVDKVIDDAQDASQDTPKIVNQGQDIDFTINVYIPKDIASYRSLGTIKDTMDAKLTFKEITSIKVENTDVTNLFNVVSNPSGENQAEELRITAKSVQDLEPYAGKVLEIKYKAFADEDTASGVTMVNNVSVENYQNQWEVEGTTRDETPPAVKTPSNKITITKVDGTENEKKLQGVKFKLFKVGENGQETEVGTEMTTNAEGVAEWTGLANGTYHLRETSVANAQVVGAEGLADESSDYRLLNKPIVIELNNATGELAVVEKTVENFKTNVFIPNTGTAGVLHVMLAGGTLLLGASLGFRKEEDKE